MRNVAVGEESGSMGPGAGPGDGGDSAVSSASVPLLFGPHHSAVGAVPCTAGD